MPSTTSSTVSADFDSSTVMTPSLPTFSIASAIRLPIVLSLLEAIVATCAISFLSLVDLLSFFSSSVTASTAASIPRLRPIGLAPAVTFFRPSRKMAWASTVAVVVPSPAMSEVLEATSFNIWAPMSSYGSFSSISLATATPSLVIVGLPNCLSMTTLRPFGPSVAFTASAMMLTPRSSAARASSANLSCFGIAHVPPYSRMARTSSSRMIRYSLSSSLTSEPEYFPNRILSPAFTSSGIFLPSSVTLPLPTAITLASCGFSLAVSGMMIPPFLTSFSSSRSTRSRSCNGRIFIRSSSCGGLHLPRFTFLGVRPDLSLGDDRDDRPGERDVHRREEPPASRDAQRPEDPAPHDTPDQAEHQIPDQPVPSILHHDLGQPASQQPHDHPRDEHSELHDPSSFFGGRGASAAASPSRFRLTRSTIALYKLYIKYSF